MKRKGYQTNAEYIESMMKQFKLVDMREQYRDLIVNALLGCHDLVLSCCHEIARISVMECSL